VSRIRKDTLLSSSETRRNDDTQYNDLFRNIAFINQTLNAQVPSLISRDGNKVRGMRSNFSRMLLHKFIFA